MIFGLDSSEKLKEEYSKVTCGLLIEDFLCDRCNQKLPTNSLAYLIQHFPSLGYESLDDFSEYFNDSIFVAYKPDQEHSLPWNVDGECIKLNEIKNVLPEDIRHLYKEFFKVNIRVLKSICGYQANRIQAGGFYQYKSSVVEGFLREVDRKNKRHIRRTGKGTTTKNELARLYKEAEGKCY